MLYNLLDNAIKYNLPGGSAEIEVKNTNNHASVTVRDTGIGIEESDKIRIFERFYRVDKSHSRATGGTGLGLSIVKHSVARCHVNITLSSRVKEGSTFTVNFPLLNR